MTRHYALEAIRAQPWAILPAHLGAIEAIADRALQAPVLDILRADGHAERYRACLSAVADTGKKMDGTNSVMLNRQGVATIPVMGPIFPRANMMTEFSGATSLSSLMADLQAANASPDVSQILMVFDSPGGATTDLSNAASQIAASSKPVTAFVPGQAASAAYWLASQCSAIWMADTALVGSIGVVMSGGKQVEPDANGVMGVDVVSSNAPNKRLDVTTEDGQAQIRTVLDDLEAIFFQAVASGRNTTVDAVKQNFGRGGMKAAKSAITSGMADGVSTLADTLARLGAASPPLKPAKAAPRRAAALADLQARRKHSEGHA